MAIPTANASWRDSARYPKFFMFDSRSVFPFIAFLLHIKMWTFIAAVVTMLFFTILMRYGFTLAAFGRFLRSTIAGKRKLAKPWWAYGYN